jgi:hypothetical protein
MAFPLQVATQDKVLAAQIRGTLNKGPEWGTAGSTVATIGSSTGGVSGDTVSSLSLLALTNAGTPSATSTVVASGTYSAADLQTIVGKVNTILNVLRNLNLPVEG